MGTYTEYEHTFTLECPASVGEFQDAIREIGERWNYDIVVMVIGWWEVWNWGEGIGRGPAYIAYPHSDYYIHDIKDGWLHTRNRGHVLRPPKGYKAYWAVEGIKWGHWEERKLATIPLEKLAPGSPIGYAPTRMFPMEDIVTSGDVLYPEEYFAHAGAEPDPKVLAQLETTPHGAILWQPNHSIHIDRVWHYLARTQGLIAQKDIEAYAIGWWQERNNKGGATGAYYLAFDQPQRLWGFHHPPGTTKASWIYWYDWFTDMKPLPKAAGEATWAVEFVRKGERPTLQTVDLVSHIPQRSVSGVSRQQPLTESQLAAVGGKKAAVSDQGKALLHLPIRELAGMFWSQDVKHIAQQAWECAVWITQHPVHNEPLPVSVRRYHVSRWENGTY